MECNREGNYKEEHLETPPGLPEGEEKEKKMILKAQIKKKHRNMIPVLLFVLFIMNTNVLGSTISDREGGADSVQYPLDDPRNPDCPCHEQQKLADEEFAVQQSFLRDTVKNEMPVIDTSIQSKPPMDDEEKKVRNAVRNSSLKKKRAKWDSYKKNRWRFAIACNPKKKNNLERCYLF